MSRISGAFESLRAGSAFGGLRRFILPALLLASPVSKAAISFVQQNNSVPATPQSSVSVTYTAAQVAGDTNIVAVGWNDSTSSATSVTDTQGNAYTLVLGPTRQSGVHSESIFVAKNVVAAAASANTVTVSFNTAAPYPDVRILSYRGLDTVSPVEAVAGATGTGTALNSGPVTTTNANDLLFGACYVSTHVTAPGTGFTSRVITTPDGDLAEDQVVTAAGTYSATATMASGNWVMQLVALKAAGSQAAAATPTFTPAPGTYTSAQTVHLNDTTTGATIYYTTDGSTPTTSSAAYNDTNPIQVTVNTTIKAMAAASGFANSAVVTGTYTIGTSASIAFVQGNYAVPSTSVSSVPVTFTGAQTAGNTNIVAMGWTDATSTINSVTDTKGNTYSLAIGPTRQSGLQSLAIYVASNIAAATAGSNTVTVAFSAAVPWADVRVLEYSGLASSNPLDGTVGAVGTGTTSNSGTLTTSNANDLLFAANYVTSHTSAAGTGFTSRMITPDGDIAEDQVVSTAGSYSATAPMTSGSWVMQLIALKGGSGGGLGAAATPTFNPAPGTYATAQTVHLLDATQGATIYYTLNDGTPTTSSAVYNDATPIQVSANTTIRAMAAASGFANSSVATGAYTIQQASDGHTDLQPGAGRICFGTNGASPGCHLRGDDLLHAKRDYADDVLPGLQRCLTHSSNHQHNYHGDGRSLRFRQQRCGYRNLFHRGLGTDSVRANELRRAVNAANLGFGHLYRLASSRGYQHRSHRLDQHYNLSDVGDGHERKCLQLGRGTDDPERGSEPGYLHCQEHRSGGGGREQRYR